jgi:hypothetical protein
MELSRPPLVVTFELSERRKAIVADVLAGAGEELGFPCTRTACFRTRRIGCTKVEVFLSRTLERDHSR